MGNSEKVTVVCLALISVALLFTILGLSTPGWWVVKITEGGTDYTVNTGLWEFCVDVPLTSDPERSRKYCAEILKDDIGEEDDAWFNTVRAMVILGMIALIVAAVDIALTFALSNKKLFLIASMAADFVAAIFLCIAIAVFGAKIQDTLVSADNWDLGYSYWLTMIATIFCLVSGGAGIGAVLSAE